MRVWYTSDLHLGHQRLAEFRGFDTVEEHDQMIIDNWNRVVGPKDQVWVLGDVALSSAGLAKVALLNGTKDLITGNHDGCWPGHRDAHKKQAKWLKYFQSVQPFGRRRVGGTEFLLSHFPYEGDHTPEDRGTQYRLRDEGMLLVHGHTHSDMAWDSSSSLRQFHVGLDAWGLAPVSQETVLACLHTLLFWAAI